MKNEKNTHTEIINLYMSSNKNLSDVTNKLKFEKTVIIEYIKLVELIF